MALRAEIGVLGGGIIGTSVALSLAKHGRTVALLEAMPVLGGGATRAAIGGITPVSDDFCRSELRLLSRWSAERYATWVSTVAAEAGIEVPFLNTGLLYVALDYTDLEYLTGPFSQELESLQVDFSIVNSDGVQVVEPALTDKALGLVHIPIEGAVEPLVLIEALTRVLQHSTKAQIITDCRIEQIHEDVSCIAVSTNRGLFEFERVVVCLGLGASQLMPLIRPLLIGVRGQALELRVPGSQFYPLRHHIYAHVQSSDDPKVSAYLVPRIDGRVIAGVTYEPGEESIINTAIGVERVLAAASSVVPSSSEWEFCRAWSGIRPGTIDGKPIIGFYGGTDRLLIATGHFGLGVTLAPVTSQIVLELLSVTTPEVTRDFDIDTLGISESRISSARRVIDAI